MDTNVTPKKWPPDAGWVEILGQLSICDELYDPVVCIRVMQRGGYIRSDSKLTFNYGACSISRFVQSICIQRLESLNWIRTTPTGFITINSDIFKCEPLIRGHQ